jgi:hypothetical protein
MGQTPRTCQATSWSQSPVEPWPQSICTSPFAAETGGQESAACPDSPEPFNHLETHTASHPATNYAKAFTLSSVFCSPNTVTTQKRTLSLVQQTQAPHPRPWHQSVAPYLFWIFHVRGIIQLYPFESGHLCVARAAAQIIISFFFRAG